MNPFDGFKSYKQLERWALLFTLGSNSLGAFLTFFYLTYVAPLPKNGAAASNPSFWDLISTATGTILLLSVGAFMGGARQRFYPKWFDFLLNGGSYKDVPEKARREVLLYPYWAMITSLTMWLIAGVTFGLLLGHSLRSFFGIFFVGGVFTSVTVFLAMETIWRRVIPLYFPEGGVQELSAFRVPILPRLLATFFLVGVFPLGILAALSLERVRNILLTNDPQIYMRNMLLAEIFIFVSTAVASTFLAWLVTHSIADPLHELKNAMSRVAGNELNVRIPVKSNDEMGFVIEHFNEMVKGLQRGELLRNLLNLYVSPEVAREALEHGTGLGGQMIECTVLFSDLRSFTALSETLPPNELISLLNRYMDLMVEVIVSHGGMVNKFGGDSLLAVFGTPLNPAKDHASRAVQAALQMRDALVAFNRMQKEAGSSQLQCGIAVATGKVVAGNVGGKERIEYTVIGDTVNLAARLQAMSKELHHDILLNSETYSLASRDLSLHAEEIANLSVRGKSEPVTIFVL